MLILKVVVFLHAPHVDFQRRVGFGMIEGSLLSKAAYPRAGHEVGFRGIGLPIGARAFEFEPSLQLLFRTKPFGFKVILFGHLHQVKDNKDICIWSRFYCHQP
jgi:hypothetical protein